MADQPRSPAGASTKAASEDPGNQEAAKSMAAATRTIAARDKAPIKASFIRGREKPESAGSLSRKRR